MKIRNDVDELVDAAFVLPDDSRVGLEGRLDMGKRGATPRTVRVRIVARQRLYDNTEGYRVEITHDPTYPDVTGTRLAVRYADLEVLQ